VEFTRGSHAVTTIDMMDSAYYGAGGDPFLATGILGSTRSPPQPLQLAPQSPPPSDLSSRSGSSGRSNEAEWGRARGVMRGEWPPRAGQVCAARGGGRALGHVGREMRERKGRLGRRRGRCEASGVDRQG
jgi:hypothetical protein